MISFHDHMMQLGEKVNKTISAYSDTLLNMQSELTAHYNAVRLLKQLHSL